MEDNTTKIGVNPSPATVPQTTQSLNTPTPEAPQATPASSTPQPTSPVINANLNIQLDKSVDTQLGRLGGAESKLLSAKSYLIIGIAILALAATAYGSYIFFFAAESATEENFEDITLTNKLGGTEASKTPEEPSAPPSLTINLSEKDTAEADAETIDTSADETTAEPSTTSKVPR